MYVLLLGGFKLGHGPLELGDEDGLPLGGGLPFAFGVGTVLGVEDGLPFELGVGTELGEEEGLPFAFGVGTVLGVEDELPLPVSDGDRLLVLLGAREGELPFADGTILGAEDGD